MSFEARAVAKRKAAIRTFEYNKTSAKDSKILIEHSSLSVTDIHKQNSGSDTLCDKTLQCVECRLQVCIEKLHLKLLNNLSIFIERQATNADGRK